MGVGSSPIASAIVNGTITTLYSYANSAISKANAALNDLAALEIPMAGGLNITVADVFEPYEINLPSMPGAINPGTPPVIADMNSVTPPGDLSLSFPPDPVTRELVIPSRPSLTTPTMDLVTLGQLLELNLPNAPIVNLQAFNVTPPDELDITPGTWSFTLENILISDDPLVMAMIARLKNNIENGGTGLTPAIEDAIWQRDLERANQQLEDTTDKVLAMWAKKGFPLPDGLLAHSLAEVQKEHMNKQLDRSREIAIKQAELEQSNLFKSLEIGVNLAFKLIDALIKYQELVAKIQELTAKYSNEYIRLLIETHKSKIELYTARVQAYEATVRAALVEVDIYKAQLEGELAKVNINEATVKVYSEQITAAIAKYKGVLEGDQISAQIFSTQMQGVLAEAGIEESKVKIYAEKIRGVLARVEVYRAQVASYQSELEAEKIKIDAGVARITGWAKGVDAQIANQNSQIEATKAQSQFNISTAEIMNKAAEANIRLAIAEAELKTANAEITSRAVTALGNATVEAARGVAAATASMAAGAMAAVSAHAQVSYSESMSLTEDLS